MSPRSPTARTLVEALFEHGQRRPDATALIAEDRRITYGELDAMVAAGAHRLRELGVEAGERVLLRVANSIEFVVAYFSIHAAGAVAVPTDPDTSETRLRAILDDCQPKLFVSDVAPTRGDVAYLPAATFSSGGPAPRGSLPLPTDVADILYTTGTTGQPKGVVLTHGNIASAASNISTFLAQRSEDVEVVPVPFSHSFGLGRLRCMAFVGNAVVPLPGLLRVADLFGALESHRATGLAIVPAGMAVLRRMTRDLLRSAGRTLRYVELASAPISPEVRDWVLDVLPDALVVHTYGLTEASRATFLDLRTSHVQRGAIGKISPNVEVEVRGSDGLPVVAGAEGHIFVRGGMVMREYWRRPDLTTAALVDGWMRTGDIATLDAAGNIFLCGRLSEMINVGGMKVAPVEVEVLLARYPGIVEVACAGVPDPRGLSGERVKAFVVCEEAPSTTDVVAWLQEQGLETYKMPVAVERVASLPRTSSGKIMRHLLVGAAEGSARSPSVPRS